VPLNSGLCALDGWDLDESCLDIPEDTPPETIERWRKVAAELLYALTGNRFGPSCPVTVRPCRKQCAESFGRILNQGQFLGAGYQFTGPFIPYMAGGAMYNASLCGCTDSCNCGPELCQVYLPGPVYDIVSVDIDGEVVPPAEYWIYDGQYLVRSSESADESPGAACWPGCQDLTKPSGEGTFTVVYRTGIPVPALGAAAVTKLTEHYIKGCGGCGCGVSPTQNLRSLQRQGVSLEFADAQQVLDDGRTGIEIVDQFIYAYNPGKLPRALRVLSPDAPRRPRVQYGPVI
jgi:hypothetical protein